MGIGTTRFLSGKSYFFCVGKQVEQNPGIYQKIIAGGHQTGNHTFQHLNGWKTATDVYIEDVEKCTELIPSSLFRPPYGRIKSGQAKRLQKNDPAYKIIMWDILSADFDERFSPVQVSANVLKNVQPGSIIVFHDSPKAFPRLKKALPAILEELTLSGFQFKTIPVPPAG